MEEMNSNNNGAIHIHVMVSETLGKLFRFMQKELIIRGIIFLLLGILILCHPTATMSIITILIGILIAIDGGAMLAAAFRYSGPGKIAAIIGALLFTLFGVVSILSPLLMDIFWIITIGIWQLLSGIQYLCFTKNLRGTALISGILTVLVGLVLISSPVIGILTISWLLGILLFLSGAFALFMGLKLRAISK